MNGACAPPGDASATQQQLRTRPPTRTVFEVGARRERGGRRAEDAALVRHDVSGEVLAAAEPRREELGVEAAVRAVELGVGAHGAERARAEAALKRLEVRLEPLGVADVRVTRVARPVERGKVLAAGVRDERIVRIGGCGRGGGGVRAHAHAGVGAAALKPAHDRGAHLAREERVFAVALVVSPP